MTVIFSILWYLYIIVQVFLASFLIQPFLLLLLYALAKLFTRKKEPAQPAKNYQFAIIITSHQDITFIPPIVDSLLKQKYPYFNAYVVTDDCDISSLRFDDSRIHLLLPSTPLHSKTKSIRYALEHFRRDFDISSIDTDQSEKKESKFFDEAVLEAVLRLN